MKSSVVTPVLLVYFSLPNPLQCIQKQQNKEEPCISSGRKQSYLEYISSALTSSFKHSALRIKKPE